MTEYQQALLQIFQKLGKNHKDNLRRHLEAGTPILCGEKGEFFTHPNGGG